MGKGVEVHGLVDHSVIGLGVTIEEGAEIRDSIIMDNVHIGKNCKIYRSIIADDVEIGENTILGTGEMVPNKVNPKVYDFGLVTIGERTVIPANVAIGFNTAVSGMTTEADYPNGVLESGETLIKLGVEL